MEWNKLEVRCLGLGAPFAACQLRHLGQSHSNLPSACTQETLSKYLLTVE